MKLIYVIEEHDGQLTGRLMVWFCHPLYGASIARGVCVCLALYGTGKDLSHNKLQICTFCPDLKPKFSNFARHLLHVHKKEDEVETLSA